LPADRFDLKQKIESELKWQFLSGKMPSKFSCSSGKGLRARNYLFTIK